MWRLREMKKANKISGILIMIGLLLMTSLEPGETLGPYIAVMAAALATVIAGARLGGYWKVQKCYKKSAAGDGSPTSGTRK